MEPSRPRTMTAVTYDRYGPPEVLHPAELPVPEVGPGHVLLEMAAVAVSSAEAAMRAADPPVARLATGLRRPRVRVPGSELSGRVVEVAPDVTDLRVGDRMVTATGVRAGGYAEYVAVPAAATAPVPDGVDLVDAVAVVEGGLTALPFLRDHGAVGEGTRLLVIGAAGSVGSSAVQLGADLGAVVTGVCSTDHVDLARTLGAVEVVDRTLVALPEWPGPHDVVLDAVGAASFRRCRRLLAADGIYLTTVPDVDALVRTPLARRGRGKRAALAFTGLRRDEAKVADMRHLLQLAAEGRLRPVVDRRMPLREAAAAHRHVETRRKTGSLLLVP